jgi:hypothetical protein
MGIVVHDKNFHVDPFTVFKERMKTVAKNFLCVIAYNYNGYHRVSSKLIEVYSIVPRNIPVGEFSNQTYCLYKNHSSVKVIIYIVPIYNIPAFSKQP